MVPRVVELPDEPPATVGRIVHYYGGSATGPLAGPHAAIVTFVNLYVYARDKKDISATAMSVPRTP